MEPSTVRPANPILWNVVEEHLDEAAFLLDQWSKALYLPTYDLDAIAATLESRLEAHLDGLVVGGAEVEQRLLWPELKNGDEPVRAIAAALVILLGADELAADRVLDAMAVASRPLQEALVRALILSGARQMNAAVLRRLRESSSSLLTATLIEILTGRGIYPGQQLLDIGHSEEAPVVSAVLLATRRFGIRQRSNFAESCLDSEDASVRLNAIYTGLAFGSRRAWEACLQDAKDSTATRALEIVAMLGQPDDHRVIFESLSCSSNLEKVLWLVGYCGTLNAGDLCVEYIGSKNGRLAKIAADSLAWISGLNLKDAHFHLSEPEPESDTLPPLEGDNLEANLELDGVDALPIPNGEVIAEWWQVKRSQFEQDGRYLSGESFSSESAARALRRGSLWRRHGLALEISLRSGGQHWISSDAFSKRQQSQMTDLSRIRAGRLF